VSKEVAADRPEDDVEMGFFEHIGELRKRLLRSIYGVVPAVFFCWSYKERLLDWLFRPLRIAYAARGFPAKINFLNPVDPFVAYMEVSLIAAIVLTAPWIFYQLWSFIAPGLYRRERLLAIPFVIVSTGFFVGGVAFGYFIVFPPGLGALLEFATKLPSGFEVTPELTIGEYMTFATRMLLGFGVVFEVPVVCSFLAFARMVTWRQLLSFFRWWLIIAAIISAVLTPPDVGSQMMMLVPLLALYMVSVGFAYIISLFQKKEVVDPSVET
jgi:sec-independent protein translocase protein TatC